jgi:hypothetical protein
MITQNDEKSEGRLVLAAGGKFGLEHENEQKSGTKPRAWSTGCPGGQTMICAIGRYKRHKFAAERSSLITK